MSLNWKEVAIILEEENLTGCKIQDVIQNSFHSLTWELYSREKGCFNYYTEVGTDTARIHVVSSTVKLQKTAKLQRFIQFARKNIIGSIITDVCQMPYDRCVIWTLDNHGKILKIFIRLYSGSGANIIVTDQNNKILDLLLRRPNREEITGQILKTEIKTQETKTFEVRPYIGSFNAYIEKSLSEIQTQDTYDSLLAQVKTKRDQELSKIESTILSAQKTIENNKDNITCMDAGQLLQMFPQTDLKAYYTKYRKAKGAFENATNELEKLKQEYEAVVQKFDKVLTPSDDRAKDIAKLKSVLQSNQTSLQKHIGPGLQIFDAGFEILVGRNAKENDELLRHHAKANDMWMHTRDFPGGYVFIKYKKDKTIPLDVLLDCANLATLFSKGKSDSSVNLYYTQVRYLRRAKGGKTGLVLPTQEKNLTIKPDRLRIKNLLPNGEANDQ